MSGWRKRALLLAIVWLAFALRVYQIEGQAIWGDEAFSIYTAKQNIGYIVSGGTDVHPPLYHLLLHYWMLIVGHAALAVRLLSVLWSMLIVAAGYALAERVASGEIANRKLVLSPSAPLHPRRALHAPRKAGAGTWINSVEGSQIAWLSAFLIAISPYQIFYAQETRMYAQAAALCVLSLLFFVKAQTSGAAALIAKRQSQIGWFITTLLAIYTHYFSCFILAAENIFVLWRAIKNRSNASAKSAYADSNALPQIQSEITHWFGAQALIALLYLPWIITQINDLSRRANARASTLSLNGFWDVVSRTLAALFVGTTLEGNAQIFFALLFLLLAVVGYFALRTSAFAMLFALSIILPILGAMILNPLLPYFRERFLLLASPAFIILMAGGVWRVTCFAPGERHASHITPAVLRMTFYAVIGLVIVSTLNNYWYNSHYRKGEYEQAIAAIRANAQPNDALIIFSPMQDALYDYYRIDSLATYALPSADLHTITTQYPRAWLLLYGDPAVYDPTYATEKFLSERGFKSFYQSYRDGALARYDFAQGGQANQVTEKKRIQLGDAILLVGFSLPQSAARSSTLPVTLEWQALAPLPENYTVFVHLLGPDGKVIAQMDTQPVGGTRPTKTWQVGETIRDHIGVTIPFDTPIGRYKIEVGMYLLQSLRRLPIGDAAGLRVQDDALIIADVEVK